MKLETPGILFYIIYMCQEIQCLDINDSLNDRLNDFILHWLKNLPNLINRMDQLIAKTKKRNNNNTLLFKTITEGVWTVLSYLST